MYLMMAPTRTHLYKHLDQSSGLQLHLAGSQTAQYRPQTLTPDISYTYTGFIEYMVVHSIHTVHTLILFLS